MHIIQLISHPSSDQHSKVGKPMTMVEGDCTGIRTREPHEVIHLRDEDESDLICTACGKRANIWFGSKDRHDIHPARCV